MNVEIIDITDRSGSMDKLREAVIVGFNKLIDEQKLIPGEARMTHIQFDNLYEPKYQAKPLHTVEHLNYATYQPRGGTALLDAIGRTLNLQGERIAREKWADKVIVCIRTDGEENSSLEFSLEQVKRMIQHAQEHGWVFIFAAANQDAFQVGAGMGISGAYTQNFAATRAGTMDSYAYASTAMSDLRTKIDTPKATI